MDEKKNNDFIILDFLELDVQVYAISSLVQFYDTPQPAMLDF